MLTGATAAGSGMRASATPALSLTQSAGGCWAAPAWAASAAGTLMWRAARGLACAEASHSAHRNASSLRQ